MRNTAALPLALFLATGCGPNAAVAVDGTDGASTGTPAGATSGSASTGTRGPPTTATTTPSATTTSEETTSTGEPDDASGDASGSTTGSCGFTCPPVPPPPQDPCAPPAQGCAEDEKCIPRSWDGIESWERTVCVPISPDPVALGEACSREGGFGVGLDDCDAGLLCDRIDPRTNVGICASLCTAFGSSVCPEGTICSDPFEIGTGLCTAPCDPLGDDCAANEACWPTGLSFACFHAPAEISRHACELDVHCGAGRLCVAPDDAEQCEDQACCADLCDVTEDSCGDQTCTSLGAPLAAHANVGYCDG